VRLRARHRLLARRRLDDLVAGAGQEVAQDAAVVFLIFTLPAISGWMVYPRVNLSTAPGMILFGGLMALAAGWAGGRLGERLGGFNRSV